MINLAPNCHGFWKMNENAASTDVEDFSLQNNEGTFTDATGNPYTNQHDATGKINGALSFDGLDDYINIGTMGDFGSNINNVTIAAWVKIPPDGWCYLCGTQNIDSPTCLVTGLNQKSNGTYLPGALRLFTRDDNGQRISAGADFNTGVADNSWHLVIVILQKSLTVVFFYVDNVQKTTTYVTQQSGTNYSNFQYPMLLGANNNRGTPNGHLEGLLDNFVIFDKALSSDERSFLWNGGNGRESLSELHRRLVGGSLAANKRGLVCI
jgi:hypothetical protein